VNKTESWIGRSFEVVIEKVAHGGIFVSRPEGRVVFVSHVLPGEKAKVRVFEDAGKGFCRAEPIQILDASADRVEHVWAEAGLGGAGGAEFGHIKLDRQRELKADVLEEALDRFAGIKLRVPVESAPGDNEANGLGYRTRVQLHVDEQGFVGPYRERSHEVVRVKSLPLATEDIQELSFQTKNYQSVEKIEVMASSTGQVQWLIDKKLQGDERLIERAGGRTFRITGGGFWQVHKKAPEVLTSAVNDLIEKSGCLKRGANNLDLYGGVGLFTGTIAAKFGTDLRMTTVESFKQATADATLNLKDLPNVKAVCEPVERFMATHKDETGDATVVLDPPRSGAGGKVVGQLLKLAPKHIVYVACDPIALARDLKQLTEHYELAGIRAFDLFPHTHHIETIASLIRK
jgi:tRNA/tmRNA/rRNA uracil-C5-methylase (TrmA/RlmC/RlmD family)